MIPGTQFHRCFVILMACFLLFAFPHGSQAQDSAKAENKIVETDFKEAEKFYKVIKFGYDEANQRYSITVRPKVETMVRSFPIHFYD